MRKLTAAPRLAPSRRKPMAAGTTPQEQSGKGTPISEASKTLRNELAERRFLTSPRGKKACTSPARSKPKSKEGESSSRIRQVSSAKVLKVSMILPFSPIRKKA